MTNRLGLQVLMPGSLWVLFVASPIAGQGGIPPQLLSVERAEALWIDQETLARRFGAEAERCRRDPGEGYRRVPCLLIEGMSDSLAGRRDAGLARLEEGERFLEQRGDHLGVALFRLVQAEMERQTRHPAAAIELYLEAVAAAEALVKSRKPLTIESFMLFGRLAGFSEARLQQLRAVAPVMGPFLATMVEAMVRDRFATLLLAQRRLCEAEAQLELALERSEAILKLLHPQILDHLGQLRERQERYEEASSLFEQSRAAARRAGDVRRCFDVLRRKAEVEIALGRSDEALAALEKARSVARELGDLSRESRLLGDFVDFHYFRGDIDLAKALAKDSLKMAGASGDAWALALARFHFGGLSLVTGSYEVAARHLEQAVSTLGEMEPWRQEVTMMKINGLLHLGEVYLLLGRPQLTAERARAARELTGQVDFLEAEALAEVLEAWDVFLETADGPERDASRLRAAMAKLIAALRESDVLTLRQVSTSIGGTLGHYSRLLDPGGEIEESETRREKVPEFRSLFEGGMAEAMARAAVQVQEGRLEEARDAIEAALAEARAIQNVDMEAYILGALASVSWQLGEEDRAVEHALRALDVLEGLVGGFQVDDLLMAFLGGERTVLYDVAIGLLAQRGRVAEAFDVAERGRARALLHQLGNQRLRVSDDGRLAELEDLRSEILGSGEVPTEAQRAEYDELMIRAKLEDPEYAALVRVEPLSLVELQREVLPPETTLVAFYALPTRIFVWLVDRESIRMVPLDLSAEELADLPAFGGRFALGPSRGALHVEESADLRALEQKYFEKLIEPILPYAQHPSWILVPHRALHYVPFAALADRRGRRLGWMKTLSYAPSANVLRHMGDKVSAFEGRALVLGDPDTERIPLDGARREARAVARLFGAQPLLGEDATESRLTPLAGPVDLLHIAAHGVFRPKAPRFSHLALAAGGGEDGRLEVEEIFRRMDLEGVDLVTLSACSTAQGERTEGDEVLGLTRAFLYAGSPAVVSSLWQVDDRATSFLMTVFYEELKAQVPYAKALRRAQRRTSEQPGWSDPFYWAAFTLTGAANVSWGAATPSASRSEAGIR